MVENDYITDEVMDIISEDEEMTQRQGVAEVPECLRNTPVPTWVFTGKYAMPCSEHLIPFRT